MTIESLVKLSRARQRRLATRYLSAYWRKKRTLHPNDYNLHFETFFEELMWRISWLRLGRRHWEWPTRYALARYVRFTDDGVDETKSSLQRVGDIRRLLNHRPAHHPDQVAHDVDALVVWAIQTTRHHGLEVMTTLSQAFDGFAADAKRLAENRDQPRAPTMEEFKTLNRGNYWLAVTYNLISGLDMDRATKLAALVAPFLFWCDTLFDIEVDVKHGRLNFTDQHCRGFTTAQLLTCNSWESLGLVPGFPDWYRNQASHWIRNYHMAIEPEIDNAIRLLPKAWWRRISIGALRASHAELLAGLEECQNRYPVVAK